MTDAELLAKIKNGLGITGTFQDATLTVYVDEVKAFMRSAGVDNAVINSTASVGCIMRGVADLWNYGSGNATFSENFRMRLLQLKVIKPEKPKDHEKVKKVAPYLYKTKYNELDYDFSAEYFEKYRPTIGACSSVSKGELFGRNFDWNYDERCMMVIKTSADNDRHATLCVAIAPVELTAEMIEKNVENDLFKIVPFLTVDGINDAGLICEINVVSTGDKGLTTGTNQDGEDLYARMIPRYVLDYAQDVDDAIELLRGRNIFCANSKELKQEYHFMLSDGTKTAVVEFIENEMTVIETFVGDKPIMTNFYLDGYDGSHESLTRYANGVERFALLADGYASVTNESGMIALMQEVKYTKTYDRNTSPFWYSEFSGDYGEFGDLTKDTPHEQYDPIVNYAIDLFNHRKRDGKTWQTVTASVYNISERKLIILPQEGNSRFTFHLGTE